MFFPASGLMAKAHAGRYLKLRFLKILVQIIPRFYLILVMIQSLQPPRLYENKQHHARKLTRIKYQLTMLFTQKYKFFSYYESKKKKNVIANLVMQHD